MDDKYEPVVIDPKLQGGSLSGENPALQQRVIPLEELATKKVYNNPRFFVWATLATITVLILLSFFAYIILKSRNVDTSNQVQTGYPKSTASVNVDQLNLGQLGQLDVNGSLYVNGALVVKPSVRPSSPISGQIYYGQDNNRLYYFDGSNFRDLLSSSDSVTSLGGVNGAINLGSGLVLQGNTLSAQTISNQNSQTPSVSSVQGQSGNVVFLAGSGISISGTTISNSSITSVNNFVGAIQTGRGLSLNSGTLNSSVSLTSSSASLLVTDDGNGNYTISQVGSGSSGSVALGPAIAQTDASNFSSINIDKTGAGNLIELSVNGTNTFVVNSSGTLSTGTVPFANLSGVPSIVNSLSDGVTTSSGNITVGSGLALSGNTLSATGSGISAVNGTANQVNASTLAGVVTLSLPQDINTNSTPSFTGLSLSGLSNGIVQSSGGTLSSGAVDRNSATLFTNNLSVANGGTGSNTSAGARSNLGAASSGANSDITSLSGLTTALSVVQGGTGVGSLAQYGVLIGNGSSPVSSLVAGGSNMCLVSTATAPVWSSCPGASGVSTVNGLNGAISIANASGVGSVITIDDATTLAKGIASFNSSFFSVTSGAVSLASGSVTSTELANNSVNSAKISDGTITGTDIASTTVTNANLVNSSLSVSAGTGLSGGGSVSLGGTTTLSLADTSVSAGTYGASNKSVVLTVDAQGRLTSASDGLIAIAASQITSGILGVSNGGTGASSFTSNGILYGNGSGALQVTAAGTTGQCLLGTTGSAPSWGTCTGAGGVSTVNTFNGAVTIQGTVDQVNVSNSSGTITLSTPQSINTTSSPQFSSLTLTSNLAVSGNGTISGGSLTIGGNAQAGSMVIYDGSSNTATIQTSALNQNTVYTIPDPGAGTATICLSTGNCAGAGGGVTTAGGTNGTIALFNGTSTIADSILSQSGSVLTNSGSFVVQGASGLTLGVGSSVNGLTKYYNSVGSHSVSIQAPGSDPASDLVLKLPSTAGSNNDCLKVDGSGNLFFGGCAAAGSGVTSLDTLSGALTLANSSGVGSTITIDDATTLAKGIASFNSSYFTVTSGAVSIASGAITGTELASNSVNSAKISDGTVTGTDIASATITGSNIASATVANANLVNSSLTVTAGSGLSGGGAVSLGSSTTLSVVYGGTSGSAVQGNTSLTCASGTGNLSGGGNSITLGSGGSCNNISISNAPTFTTSVTTPQLILTGAGSNGTIAVATLGQATAYTLPDPGAGTATICLSTGNCAGAGSGVTTAGGTANKLAKFSASQAIANSNITDTGALITLGSDTNISSGALQTAGTVRLANNGALQNVSLDNTNSVTANANIITSGTLGVGVGGTGAGSFTQYGVIYGNSTGALQVTTVGTTGQCLLGNTGAAPTWGACTGAGGVSSLNTFTGAVTVQGTSNQVNVANNTGTITLSLPQSINTAATPQFGGLTLTGALAVNTTAGLTTTSTGTVAVFNTSALGLNIGGAVDATGINFAGGSASTGCTIDGSNGNLTCSGNITGASTGTAGYFSRSGTTLSPATAGDNITTSGNISTSGSGTITAAGGASISSGLNNNNGGITNAGAVSGASTITASSTINTTGGAIQTNSTDRITNGGGLTNITGYSQTTGTFAFSGAGNFSIDSSAFDVTSGGVISGVTGYGQTGNFLQSGSGTFGTGTGTVSLNGNTDIANNVSFATKVGTTFTTPGTSTNAALNGASFYLLDTSGAAQVIQGITAGRDGQRVTLTNVDASNLVTLADNNISATGSKIITGLGADVTLAVGASIELIYDSTNSVWRVQGGVAGGNGTCSSCASTTLNNLGSTNINSALNATSANLTLQTTTSGNVILSSASNVIDLKSNVSNSTGNLVLDDTVDIGSATTGIRVATDGSISDINGDLVLNDQVDIGSATTGLQITTTGVITDIDGTSVQIGENLTVGAGATTTAAGETLTVKTGNAWGIVQTNGTQIEGTYVDATGGWFGTYSNDKLQFFTNNGAAAQTIYADGTASFKNYTNSNTAFQILNSGSAVQFNVDNTNGAITVGGTAQTGTITVGQSNDTNTITIGSNNALASGKTQTINIGTSTGAGSTTTINVGSTIAGVTTLQSQGGVKVTTLGSNTANSTYLCRDTSTNLLTTCNTTGTSGIAFMQGGNSFANAATLGTNDANNLELRTNSTTRAAFDQSNNLILGNAGGGGTNTAPTDFTVKGSGSSTAGTTGGAVTLIGGAGASTTTGSQGGAVTIQGGTGQGTNARNGGLVTIQGGTASATGAGGGVTIVTGAGGATSGASGALSLQSGGTTNGNSGTVTLQSGSATTGTAGNVTIDVGTSSTGTPQINIGTSTNSVGKTITIGGSTGTGQITLGSSSASQTVVVAGGTGQATVQIANDGTSGNTVTIAGGATANTKTDTINIGTGNTAGTGNKVVHIADGTPAGTGSNQVTIGSLTGSSSTTTIQGGTGSSALSFQTGASGTILIGSSAVNNTVTIGKTGTTNNTTTINIGNTTSTGGAQTIYLGGTNANNGSNTSTTVALQGGQTALAIANSGTILKTFTDSATAFQIQDSAGTGNTLVVDTRGTNVAGGAVGVGKTAATDGTRFDVAGHIKSSDTSAGANSLGGSFQAVAGATTGVASFVSNWDYTGYFGLGPATWTGGGTNNTVQLGNVSNNLTGTWGATQNTNLILGSAANGGGIGIGTGAAPTARLQITSSANDTLLRITDSTATSADVLTIADGGATTFKSQTNSTVAFAIQNAAGTSLLNADSTNLDVTVGGNLLVNKSSQTNQEWTKISGTAGTIGGNNSAIDRAYSSVFYNGNLYIGTNKTNAAEIYRYDGNNSWTKVSPATPGTIGTAGTPTTSIDEVRSFIVYNGSLYAGTSEPNKAEVYRYDGGTTWTLVTQTTAGTIASGGTAGIDKASRMIVFDNKLYLGIDEDTTAEIYRYDGGTTWTLVSNNNHATGDIAVGGNTTVDGIASFAIHNNQLYAGTVDGSVGTGGEVYRYDGGTTWTAVSLTPGTLTSGGTTSVLYVYGLIEYNGQLYASTTDTTNGAEIYRYNDTGTSWTKISQSAGQIASGGTSGITYTLKLENYAGKMYVSAASSSNTAEVYRYDGGTTWTKVTQTTAGTIASGGTAGIDSIFTLISYGGSLYAGTGETGSAEVYRYSDNLQESRTSDTAGVFSISAQTGSASFQNSTDSSTAFLIQNTAGVSLFNVDSKNAGGISLIGSNTGETGVWQTNTNTMAATRALLAQSAVVSNGYMYVIGGENAGAKTTVYYAKFKGDGSVGAFTSMAAGGQLPSARYHGAAVVASGYVYYLGGANSTNNATNTVYFSKINDDGTLGSWATSSSNLPGNRKVLTATFSNGYIFAIGGNDDTNEHNEVYSARVNSNGSLGAWTSVNAFTAGRSGHSTVIANGYMYVIGGYNSGTQTNVYYAQINYDGTLGTWSSATSLPTALRYHSSVVVNGYVYVIGGTTATTGTNAVSTVYYAKLKSDGTIGPWTLSANSLPANRDTHASVTYNGYIYAVGGDNASTDFSSVIYASTARITIGGSLDLVGTSGGLGDSGDISLGSVGGQLTAGNTKVVGTLEVLGQAAFSQGVSIGDNLNVNGGIFASGDIKIDRRTNSGGTSSDWTVTNSTAGTIGSQTLISSIESMATYNGSLYIGTNDSTAGNAEVYRYDENLGTYTLVSSTGFGNAVDRIQSLVVYNGYLYAGTQKTNGAEVYRYDGGTTWTAVTGTAGTIGGNDTNVDGVFGMAVWHGKLYIGTFASGGASEVYRYDGGTTWADLITTAGNICGTGGNDYVHELEVFQDQLYTATFGAADICRYNGGTSWTRVNAASGQVATGGTASIQGIESMAVFNGALYAGTYNDDGAGAGHAEIYRYDGGNAGEWVKVSNATAGTIAGGGTSSIDIVATLMPYNGKLYAGTWGSSGSNPDKAEVYAFDPVANSWSKVSYTTAGKITSSGTANINGVIQMIVFNDKLYASTGESNSAEVYRFTAVNDQSYALKFSAGSSAVSSTEKGTYFNEASIYFAAGLQGTNTNDYGNTGSFVFSHGITTATGSYDVAEDYPTRDGLLSAGDVVMIDENETGFVKRSEGKMQSTVVGVYSEKPGLRLSQSDTTINGGSAVPVALAGRVPVKVSLENGPIKPGDFLTSSSTPGYAMKATEAGPTLGKALGYFDGSQGPEGKVQAFVNVSYYTPPNGSTLQANQTMDGNLNVQGSGTFAGDLNIGGKATISSLKVTGQANFDGDVVVNGSLTTNSLTVNGHILTGGDLPIASVLGATSDINIVSVEGNDTSGRITLDVPQNYSLNSGDIIKVVFTKKYNKAPKVVLTPVGKDSAGLGAYVDQTPDDFIIGTTLVPGPDKKYIFNYFIVE